MTSTNKGRVEGGIDILPGLSIPDIRNDITRRDLLIGVGGLVLLAPYGCGGGEGGEAGSSGETRTVEHVLGETEIPRNPRRVVVLDPNVVLPTLLDLGVPVIGAGTLYGVGEPWAQSYFDAGEMGGVEVVGEADQPNFESVAALEPDLVIGWEGFIEPFYDRLGEIAPTVATEGHLFSGDRWKSELRTVAELFGKRERIDEQIAAYEARAGELNARIGARVGHPEVSVARIVGADAIELYYRCAWPGAVLEGVGLRRPENQRVDDCSESERMDLSMELIPEMDADILFYFARGGGGDPESGREGARRLLNNPLWERLEVVRSDRAFQVDADAWLNAPNVRGAHLVLDDLEKHLLEEQR